MCFEALDKWTNLSGSWVLGPSASPTAPPVTPCIYSLVNGRSGSHREQRNGESTIGLNLFSETRFPTLGRLFMIEDTRCQGAAGNTFQYFQPVLKPGIETLDNVNLEAKDAK